MAFRNKYINKRNKNKILEKSIKNKLYFELNYSPLKCQYEIK